MLGLSVKSGYLSICCFSLCRGMQAPGRMKHTPIICTCSVLSGSNIMFSLTPWKIDTDHRKVDTDHRKIDRTGWCKHQLNAKCLSIIIVAGKYKFVSQAQLVGQVGQLSMNQNTYDADCATIHRNNVTVRSATERFRTPSGHAQVLNWKLRKRIKCPWEMRHRMHKYIGTNIS